MKTVLIAAADPVVQRVLDKIVQALGYKPVVCEDGVAAVRAFELLKPAIVLLDSHMREMDGLEALRQIRAMDCDARIAMVTSESDASWVREAVQLGAQDFTTKPFDIERVQEAIFRLGE